MEITTTHIIADAVKYGACQKSSSVTDWKSLVWLFFSPQGIEFCSEHNYPSIDQFRAMSDYINRYGVYVDAGHISLANPVKAGIIGGTDAVLTFANPDVVHNVIVMHGASVRIIANQYAVIRLYNVGENSIDIVNDGTAVILN